MYSVLSYGYMAADGVRMDAYARAIARVVTSSSAVLDLGAGTGVLALLAAKAGARKVYAVDTNPAVLLLKELAAENGVADRIEVFNESSLDLALPERVDVVLSDLRGATGLNGAHFALVRDARERLLRPGGVLVPAVERLMVALVDSTELAADLEHVSVAFARLGLSAEATRRSLRNTVFTNAGRKLSASHVLTSAGRWATIDYATVAPGVVTGDVELTAKRSGTANALAVWFETTVLEGLEYTTAPGHTSAYSRMLLPLEAPVTLAHDDRVRVVLRASSDGDRWAWETTIAGKASFRQATFLGAPLSKEALLLASSTAQPRRSPQGERAYHTLAAMNGKHTVGAIAERVAQDFSIEADRALDEVRELVARYGR